MPGIASAATAVVIGHIAAGTSTIRVGSGGVMLPNHAPLVIAEQFGTLESLYPGRIDLGLGRAPGTDPLTARALRRGHRGHVRRVSPGRHGAPGVFQGDHRGPGGPGGPRRRPSGANLAPRLKPLQRAARGSARAAVRLRVALRGTLDLLGEALAIYRRMFRPSDALRKPYAMAAVAVFAADTDAQAARMFTSLQLSFVNLRRGTPDPLPPPVDSMEGLWTPTEKAGVDQAIREAIVGSPGAVRAGIAAFIGRTGVDELMVTAAIHDHPSRLHSFEIIAAAARP